MTSRDAKCVVTAVESTRPRDPPARGVDELSSGLSLRVYSGMDSIFRTRGHRAPGPGSYARVGVSSGTASRTSCGVTEIGGIEGAAAIGGQGSTASLSERPGGRESGRADWSRSAPSVPGVAPDVVVVSACELATADEFGHERSHCLPCGGVRVDRGLHHGHVDQVVGHVE